MSLNIGKVKATIALAVLVQFRQDGGAVYQGDFKGEFKVPTTERIDEMMDAEPPLLNSEIVNEVLVGASDIADSEGKPLPPDEALAWVKKSPQCVNAAVAAFFKELRPERYNEKTSRKQRRG